MAVRVEVLGRLGPEYVLLGAVVRPQLLVEKEPCGGIL